MLYMGSFVYVTVISLFLMKIQCKNAFSFVKISTILGIKLLPEFDRILSYECFSYVLFNISRH